MSLKGQIREMKQNLVNKVGTIRQQRGVTLVELLVSVFVFAIGVLGFSALQTRSLQATYDNAQREDVVWMADSLISRIRANNFATSGYVAAINGFGTDCPTTPVAAPPAAACAADADGTNAACAEDSLATYDVWDVLCNNVDSNDTIRNSGGLGVVNGLQISLTCDDAITTDSDSCSTGSDLALNFMWCTKSAETETNNSDCTQAFAQQTYTLVFRP